MRKGSLEDWQEIVSWAKPRWWWPYAIFWRDLKRSFISITTKQYRLIINFPPYAFNVVLFKYFSEDDDVMPIWSIPKRVKLEIEEEKALWKK